VQQATPVSAPVHRRFVALAGEIQHRAELLRQEDRCSLAFIQLGSQRRGPIEVLGDQRARVSGCSKGL
jgi:hypothetical protein